MQQGLNQQQQNQTESHTLANNMLESKFQKPNLAINQVQNTVKKPARPKTAVIIVISVLSFLTVLILIIGVLFSLQIINLNNPDSLLISNSSSSSSVQSSLINSANFSPSELNFPRFFNNSSQSNSKSSQTTSLSQSSSANTNIYKIELKLENDNDFDTKFINFQSCQNNNFVAGGLAKKTNKTDQNNNILIAHRNLAQNDKEKQLFEFGYNYIDDKNALLSDANSDMGVDFIQYFKETCPSNNYNKIKNIEAGKLNKVKGVDKIKGQIEVFSQNDFLNYGYSIFAIKGDYMIRIYYEYNYESSFTRDEKESCLISGKPERNCLINIINSTKISTINTSIDKQLDKLYFL